METTGEFFVGKCLGVTSKERSFKSDDGTQSVRVDWYVGIQAERPNGFSEPDLVTTRLKLSKSQVQAGLHRELDKLRGSLVSVPVYTIEWKNGNGADRYVGQGYKPVAVGK